MMEIFRSILNYGLFRKSKIQIVNIGENNENTAVPEDSQIQFLFDVKI